MTLASYALLDNHLDGESYRFDKPVAELLAYDSKQLIDCLEQINDYQQQGLYLVGYVSYEAGLLLNQQLQSLYQSSGTPLLHFTAFKKRECLHGDGVEGDKLNNSQTTYDAIDEIHIQYDYYTYKKLFNQVQKALIAGDTYQLNLTTRCDIGYQGDPGDLYRLLSRHQSVSYAAYLPFEPVTLISLSPELFFNKQGDCISLKPMKGTLINDEQSQPSSLQFDEKNRAENLIIIDLIRNDLSRCCEVGSVLVKNPFSIESYQTVHQMTSEVIGRCDRSIDFKTLLTHLFPCGSITGAPKVNTMRLINQLENSRGAYTGAIGYITPDNDMCFNVAIRTLVKQNDKYSMGVGGGITVQSGLESEWQELNAKLTFVKRCYEPNFELIESVLFDKKFVRLDQHLSRLLHSAQQLLFDVDLGDIEQSLNDYETELDSNKQYKVRLVLGCDGTLSLSSTCLTVMKNPIDIYLCPEKINGDNYLLRHKTTHSSTRGVYQFLHQQYLSDKMNAELVHVNNNQQITESRFYNLVIEYGGQLITPAKKCGLLPGIYRQNLLDAHDVKEEIVSNEMLKNASRWWLINDVRGMVEVQYRGLAST